MSDSAIKPQYVKPLFPASYSTLCPDALASVLSEKYGLTNVQCRLLLRGVGDTYKVESLQGNYILRVYRSAFRNLSQVREEVDLLLALQQAQVSVAYPVTDTSGETILLLNAIEGERCAVLFTWAKGQAVMRLNENQLRTLGREMARFHNVSSSLPFGSARWTFDVDTTLLRPLQLLKPVFADDPESYEWLQQTAAHIQQHLQQLDTSGFSRGYCHFDFLPKNFHFDGDAVTLFDFDFMGCGWLVNDIMTFWQHLAVDVYAGRSTQEESDNAYRVFLEGYKEVRAISEAELAVIPYLAPGFWLFYMGFHTTHDQFYSYTQSVYRKSYTGIVRHLVKAFRG